MRIGVDLGGSKIEAVAMDAAGRIAARRRVPTPGAYDAAIAAIGGLIAEVEAEARAPGRVVGVGIPGSISPRTGLVRNANSTWLNGKPFAEDLEAALGRPVRIANDANCFALSEAVDGAGAGAKVAFGAILGTGCGAGVVIDSHALVGASGIAGEWGHMPLPWPKPEETPGALCWCGRRGCVETWVSGPGFAGWAAPLLGRPAAPAEIAAAAAEGYPAAQTALSLYVDRLARALAVVVDVLDPDVVVLGGGLSNITALYDAIPMALAEYVFSDHLAVRIVRNRHGDSSGVRGAAWLWRAEETG